MTQHVSLRLFLVGVFLFWACLPALAAKGDKAPKPKPVTLTTIDKTQLHQQLTLFGTSIPRKSVSLSPLIDGSVTEVKIDTGTWVRKGDSLLQLDSRLAEIDIRIAKAKVASAQATRRDASRKRDDLQRLKGNRHVSETSMDTAEANLEIAIADLARERAVLAREQEIRDRHQLFAPFSGMVTARHAEIGQWIKRDEPAIELVELDTLRVRAQLAQRHYAEVATGDKVEIHFDALPNRIFNGQIIARVAAGDASSRSFPLLIDIDNTEHLLAPGMSAKIVLSPGKQSETALMVPRDAVVTKSDGTRLVWRVQAEGGTLKAKPVRVKVGRAQGKQVEIISDQLVAGDRIVELGNETLKPGQIVKDHSALNAR